VQEVIEQLTINNEQLTIKKENFVEEIRVLDTIAKKLREDRYKKGSINFFTEEVKFRLDEKGSPLEVYIKVQKDSHKLVEDFMLLANRKVAELIGKKKGTKQIKTFVYRIHDKPGLEKLEDLQRFVGNLGYKIRIDTPKAIADSFNAMFKELVGKPEENIITQLAIRTMAKAYYSTDNIGHYGLAFPYYTHFTSPIRRYPDLMVHRLLEKYYLDNQNTVDQPEYEKKCRHCSDMERKAVEAERASVKYKQIEFMKDKVGENFNGVISGISKWGLYVQLDENKCEGMVRVRDLDDDFYYLDEDNYQYIGQRTGTIYKLGDNVSIKVKNADLSRKHLDFTFNI
jgi:ribonuclease R